jgi:hypothetical protein
MFSSIKMSFGMEGRPVGRLVQAQYNTWSYHKKRERRAGALPP